MGESPEREDAVLMPRSDVVECFYCDAPTVRSEQDHMPVPRRHGGASTVTACVTCHDMKDRLSLEDWPIAKSVEAGMVIWSALDREGRILLARFIATMWDDERARRDAAV